MFSLFTPDMLNINKGKQKIINRHIFTVILRKIKLIKQKMNICHMILKKREK